MSGRTELESVAYEKMQKYLKTLPSIFSEFYYHMYANKSYLTVEKYIKHTKEFADFICDGKIDENFYENADTLNINKYFASIRNRQVNGKRVNVSDSIRAAKWSSLNAFFNFLFENDYIKTNPMKKIKRPKVQDNPKVEFLTPDEINALLDNVKNKANKKMVNRDLAILKLGFVTGLRVSAIVQINIEDIDFNQNIIRVAEKGDKYFDVFIGKNVKEQLLLWISDRKKYFEDADTDALFISSYNQRITRDGVGKLLTKYSKGVTEKNVTPHVMRHSCATNLYEKTNDIYLCSSVLHHKNVTTTQRYADISKSKNRMAIDILDSDL